MAGFVSPAKQAIGFIREIGDKVSQSGQPIDCFTVNEKFFAQLIEELVELGTIKIKASTQTLSGITTFMDVNLTLQGWKQYELEKRGEFKGNYGFIAMKFNDPELDEFIANHVKPAIKNGIGYDLVDLRDVARAGVIDNILRVEIRDAAFVIADLTHDNHGAYWESGYAEGLGKPVVYICEQTKFAEQASHFDTNHCTTITWSNDNPKRFNQELIATLRRSLDHES